MDKTQIIILAAGKGTRMKMDLPKVLIPFHDKPMIDYVVEASIHSGVKSKPILVVGYKADMVKDHVGEKADYVLQNEQLGTGHAVKVCERSISEDVENVLVLYGDQPSITGAMIYNLVKTHKDSGKSLTMATVTVPDFDDWYEVFYSSFSRVVRGEDGEVKYNVEFKDATEDEKKIKELNPCYFCFRKDWLFDKLSQIKNENNQGEYYLTDVVKYAANEKSIASVSISPEEALGVNTIDQLKSLEKVIKKD